MTGPICLPCEHGEHGTVLNDLAHTIIRCDCACHHQPVFTPADPLLPKSKTQSMKALLLETSLPEQVEPWWQRMLYKLDGLFSPGKERA